MSLTSGVQFWNLSQRMMIKGWQGWLELKDYVEWLLSVWHCLDQCFPSWSPNQIFINVLGCFQKHHCPNTNLAWMTLHGHFPHVLLLATHKLHCLVLVNPTHALVYWHSFPLGKLWQPVTSFLSRKCYDMYLYDSLQSSL